MRSRSLVERNGGSASSSSSSESEDDSSEDAAARKKQRGDVRKEGDLFAACGSRELRLFKQEGKAARCVCFRLCSVSQFSLYVVSFNDEMNICPPLTARVEDETCSISPEQVAILFQHEQAIFFAFYFSF